MNAFETAVSARLQGRGSHWSNTFGGGHLAAGYQSIHPKDAYDWDGLRRTEESSTPRWLFQFTLSGWGILETERRRKVTEGNAFLVRIPSRHRYYRDVQCGEWRFCWLMMALPEMGLRLERHRGLVNGILPLAFDGPTAMAFIDLAGAIRRKETEFRLEAAAFHWLLALEAEVFQRRHPRSPRRRLLETVKKRVLDSLPHAPSVSEIARDHHMTRSNFSHHFHDSTGMTVAAFIREIRLNHAADLLRNSVFSVKEIATAAGFTDSSVFGKGFRRQFRITPGEYRRLGFRSG